MTRNNHQPPRQTGFSTLFISLLLLMLTSLMVIASSKIQSLHIMENISEKVAIEQRYHIQSLLEATQTYLTGHLLELTWVENNGYESSDISPTLLSAGSYNLLQPTAIITLTRQTTDPMTIAIQISVINDSNQELASIDILVRPHSLLSAAAESAAALIVDGCINTTASQIDILAYDLSPATDRIRTSAESDCHTLTGFDLHGGQMSPSAFTEDALWNYLFVITNDGFLSLVTQEIDAGLSVEDRHYWLVTPSDLTNAQWTTSLGSNSHPVILVFPESIGCPGIGSGVNLVGIVFYQSDCLIQPLQAEATISGMLAISGDLDLIDSQLTLITQPLSPGTSGFPIIDTAILAGSWRDFQ
ncbi:MAG: hypothetical protein V3W04_15680 [Gammaproteobacteria bacterium]